jgi:hypothetical protein
VDRDKVSENGLLACVTVGKIVAIVVARIGVHACIALPFSVGRKRRVVPVYLAVLVL